MRHKGDLLGPSPYPGDSPQATSDREQEAAGFTTPTESVRPDYTVAPAREPDYYQWSMSGTHVAVSDDNHADQFSALGWTDFGRPHAYGKVELHYRWAAYWHVFYTNMSFHLVEKRLKRYTKDQGWDWGGILDDEGLPMESQSLKQANVQGSRAGKGRLEKNWRGEGGRDGLSVKYSEVPGIGQINPGMLNYKLDEWAGTGQFDSPAEHQTDAPYYGLQDPVEDMAMTDPRTCSECGELMLDYDAWRKHVLREHVNPERKPPGEPQPVVDLDDVLPAGFNEDTMDTTVQRQSRLIYQVTAGRPTDQLIQGPMPFIYDIEEDRIFVGHPGERHSDIQGRFTPGGIIEGLYDPKGHVQIRTDTDMPYTVRHMVELWYALHPELEVKSIFLMVGDRKYKLASANIAHQVRNLAAADPAAWAASQALAPLGNVYVVGGAVRDIVLGRTPKDIDLMVQGVDAEEVADVLERLPGRVDYTGKQFGVFRYRDREENEVEIALPRTERSTGGGHRDFEVFSDPYISVGEDLARRDFTGNAMAVNLATGDLVDPYHGSEDLKSGVLRTVSDRSFLEDPLRILRAFGSVSRHGLDPSPETYHDLAAHAGLLGELPRERLQMELDKIMSGDDPAKAVDLMEATGVLQHALPEVAATTGFDQQNSHHESLLSDHLKSVLRRTAALTPDIDLRWAALLHDIGKPASQWIDEAGQGHYYQNEFGQGRNHEDVGAEMARALLTELKFPNDRIERITHLIQHHMFPTFSSQQGARKFINRVGDEHANDLLTLRTADIGGKGGRAENMIDVSSVPIMEQYVERVRQAQEPTNTSMLALNGNDLIAAGFQPGPNMGKLLRHLTELVIEDPTLNEKETLLQLAQESNPDAKSSATKTLQSAYLDPTHEPGYMYHGTTAGWGSRVADQGLEPRPIQDWHDRAPDLAVGDKITYFYDQPQKSLNWAQTLADQKTKERGYPEQPMLLRVPQSYAEQGNSSYDDTYRTQQVVPPQDVQRWHNNSWLPVNHVAYPDLYDETGAMRSYEESRAYEQSQSAIPGAFSHVANILDPIQDSLDPDVFNNAESVEPTVKPKIVEWVRRKIYKAMIGAGWPDPSNYLSLILTGSLTTYQWGTASDFDISLWIDVERFPEWVRADLIALMIETCDGVIVPGTTHPMQGFVVDSTRYTKHDLYKPGLRSGYDLDKGKWLILPERQRSIDVAKQWPEHIRVAQDCVAKMRMMLRYDKYAVKTYWNFLHRQRFLEMRAGKGDYSLSNIVYKMLANQGLLPEISEVTGEHIG